jgi:hypothetical protein
MESRSHFDQATVFGYQDGRAGPSFEWVGAMVEGYSSAYGVAASTRETRQT